MKCSRRVLRPSPSALAPAPVGVGARPRRRWGPPPSALGPAPVGVAPAPVGIHKPTSRAQTSSHSPNGVSTDPSSRTLPHFAAIQRPDVGKSVPTSPRSGADLVRLAETSRRRRRRAVGFRRMAESAAASR